MQPLQRKTPFYESEGFRIKCNRFVAIVSIIVLALLIMPYPLLMAFQYSESDKFYPAGYFVVIAIILLFIAALVAYCHYSKLFRLCTKREEREENPQRSPLVHNV